MTDDGTIELADLEVSGAKVLEGLAVAGKYGELIVLGYNGSSVSGRSNSHGKIHSSKMMVNRRSIGNGIKKATVSNISVPPRQNQAVKDHTRHVVSYTYGRNHSVIVEYTTDKTKDMFQIGRSSEDQIDITVVDTWLAGEENLVTEKGVSSSNGHPSPQRSVSSTISRYACRIFIERDPPHNAYVYAAGFDASRNIFLGEKATKWTKKNGEVDALTTNGILILHPTKEIGAENEADSRMYLWREVSVDGDIYTLRETRSSTKRGDIVRDETNQLQDGTLIDLCGATLLWRTAVGLAQSPCSDELEYRLNELNAGKPQCPVNLNTLIIPRRKSKRMLLSEKQPYVYLSCGHVQGKHEWGHRQHDAISKFQCPVCLVETERVLQLIMGMESAFHLDSNALDYAFNPCGHVASHATVRYWSRIALPHGTNSFHPVCPFCTCHLAVDKPFVRLIFQDHCFDD